MRSKDQIILENIYEKSIRDFLIQDPQTEAEDNIVNYISTLKTKSDEVYRGISPKEYKNLLKEKEIQSLGTGMTRKNIQGSYVSDSIQLAGRFAYRAYKDFGNGFILILKKDKLPELQKADEGNYWTEKITLDSVKDVVDLKQHESTKEAS